jgi:hypothetical protein
MLKIPAYVLQDWKGKHVHVQFKRGDIWDVEYRDAELMDVSSFGVHLADDSIITWDAITFIGLIK